MQGSTYSTPQPNKDRQKTITSDLNMRLIPAGLRRKLCVWCVVFLALCHVMFYLHNRLYMDKLILQFSDRHRSSITSSEKVTNMTSIFSAKAKSDDLAPVKIPDSHMNGTHTRSKLKTNKSNNSFSQEPPSIYLTSKRFDIIVKMVYAYFYAFVEEVPKTILAAYKEHIRKWNGFHENCKDLKRGTFDNAMPCKNKANASDFIRSFHRTIESIQNKGFMSNTSRIPVDKNGSVQNGAHRMAAATVLSKNVTLEHLKSVALNWDYIFFKRRGLSLGTMDFVVLEWMKIQLKIKSLKTKVSVLSVFSDDKGKDKMVQAIVLKECTKDNAILYERNINVTKLGMRQLVRHMYGNQTWIDTKIKQMLEKFKSDSFRVRFMFFFARNSTELLKCKYDIRKLYNDRFFKSSAHIPDTPIESLILSEMILNPNSVLFLNYAKNGHDCQKIAKEIGIRSSFQPIKTLPGIYVGRDDVMVDSGSVLHFFDLRKRTDVDILFLKKIDSSILGMKRDVRIEEHAFKSNAVSKGRPWGEDHITGAIKTAWDLFYDQTNYGYCYGIKYVSLDQMVRYKTKRNEKEKDPHDIKLILNFLEKLKVSV